MPALGCRHNGLGISVYNRRTTDRLNRLQRYTRDEIEFSQGPRIGNSAPECGRQEHRAVLRQVAHV